MGGWVGVWGSLLLLLVPVGGPDDNLFTTVVVHIFDVVIPYEEQIITTVSRRAETKNGFLSSAILQLKIICDSLW